MKWMNRFRTTSHCYAYEYWSVCIDDWCKSSYLLGSLCVCVLAFLANRLDFIESIFRSSLPLRLACKNRQRRKSMVRIIGSCNRLLKSINDGRRVLFGRLEGCSIWGGVFNFQRCVKTQSTWILRYHFRLNFTHFSRWSVLGTSPVSSASSHHTYKIGRMSRIWFVTKSFEWHKF